MTLSDRLKVNVEASVPAIRWGPDPLVLAEWSRQLLLSAQRVVAQIKSKRLVNSLSVALQRRWIITMLALSDFHLCA